MITYQIEPFLAVYADLLPLIEQHYVEVVPYADKFPVDVDVNFYSVAEQLGNLLLVTAREDRDLVGYCSFFIQSHHQYNASKAVSDAIYVKDDYRHKDVATSLLKFCEAELSTSGIDIMNICFKKQYALPETLGFHLEEYVYSKYIGDN